MTISVNGLMMRLPHAAQAGLLYLLKEERSFGDEKPLIFYSNFGRAITNRS